MLKLTGGEFRGRSIHTPPDRPGKNTVRPSHARLRQALFNSLQTVIADAKVLDLFAGSGALGFEALSRGASSVVFVEQAPVALKCLSRNAAELNVEDRVDIVGDSVDRVEARLLSHAPFDIVMADPPYAEDFEMKLLDAFPWGRLLAEQGYFVLEWGTQKSRVEELPERTPFLVKVREKNYGDSILTTYRRSLGPMDPRGPSS